LLFGFGVPYTRTERLGRTRRNYEMSVYRSGCWQAIWRGASFFFLTCAANATQVFTNTGFESGATGWTITNAASNSGPGSYAIISGFLTPLTGNPTAGPASGTNYAVSDDFAPGTYALTQGFTAPVGLTSALLSLKIFVNDFVGGSGTGATVDLLAAGADPITGPSLATFYTADTAVAGGVPNPYVSISNMNITASLVAGNSYQLRILSSSATGPINVGVDDVTLDITASVTGVPEPSFFVPTALVAGLVLTRARHSRKARA
jgi:hypothetical protein